MVHPDLINFENQKPKPAGPRSDKIKRKNKLVPVVPDLTDISREDHQIKQNEQKQSQQQDHYLDDEIEIDDILSTIDILDSQKNNDNVNDQHKILVYIIHGMGNQSHMKSLIDVFGDNKSEIFKIKTADRPISDDNQKNLKQAYYDGLKYSYQNMKEYPVLIILDSSTTLLNYDLLKSYIMQISTLELDYDLCYLSKWQDQCQKHTTIEDQKDIKMTYSPHGLQAIMFSPKCRDNILGLDSKHSFNIDTDDLDYELNLNVENSTFKAITLKTNLFNFDPNLARRNTDYNKFNECVEVGPNDGFKAKANANTDTDSSSSTTTNWTWLWILILILVVIFILIILALALRS
jgi:hypothetical protein